MKKIFFGQKIGGALINVGNEGDAFSRQELEEEEFHNEKKFKLRRI